MISRDKRCKVPRDIQVRNVNSGYKSLTSRATPGQLFSTLEGDRILVRHPLRSGGTGLAYTKTSLPLLSWGSWKIEVVAAC